MDKNAETWHLAYRTLFIEKAKFVGNKLKERSCYKKIKYVKFSEKLAFLTL